MFPLTFAPVLKRRRWGGRRLGELLGKAIGDGGDWAESWEIADCGADQSVVNGGAADGVSLHELVTRSADELLGRGRRLSQCPLLVKFLDAADRLSVQVHPNDVQANFFFPGQLGKTEVWVIVAAEPGARVYAGLQWGVDRLQLGASLLAGRIEECLHSYEVHPGDCIFIPAGTVHAIGEGIVLAEVQQSSDITFRLDDWGRCGSDGKPRELHVTESLIVTNFRRGPVNPVIPLPLSDDYEAFRHEQLVDCEQFVLQRYISERPFSLAAGESCHVLMGLGGTATIWTEGYEGRLSTGGTLLVPADCPTLTVEPHEQLTLLDAFLPALAGDVGRSCRDQSCAALTAGSL